MASLMQINNGITWWKAENDKEKELVINGFKELYNNSNNIIIDTNKIITLMQEQMQIIIDDRNTVNMIPPFIPRSRAKDIKGFTQRELMKIVRGSNLNETAKRFKYILDKLKHNKTNKIIIHNISKLLLKKKKDIVESMNDLRGIAIMPAIIMVLDKITILYSSPLGNRMLSKYQHGGRTQYSTNTAKMNLIYSAKTKGYTYCLLLDLSKAFDKVDRTKLRTEITNLSDNQLRQILLNTLIIYSQIQVKIDNEIINPTRGIPQGSVYGPLLFTLYINNILTQTETKFKDITILAFIDDIMITSKNLKILEEAMNFIHDMIEDLNMELNLNKCELLSENEEDTITGRKTGIKLKAIKTAKYLGQTINNQGETVNIIDTYNYSSITETIKKVVNHISMRSKIKLFNVYIKSKFAHLIPMIALTGNLELTWKNIRSTIFRDLLERKTIPRETCTLLGLSFYSIIIKPILKLLNKEHIKADEDMINFYIEAMKNIFKTWLKVEPNNTEKIKQYINELLTNNTLKSINEFEEEIYNQAAIRLYRNKTVPEKAKNLSKANMPRLLELTSNAPQHLIEEVIKQKIIDSEDIEEETLGKMIHEQILGYITINQTLECEIPKIEKPNQENIKDILEYQQLYDKKLNMNLN